MPEYEGLEPDDVRVLDHLSARWSELFRLTTIEQGMLSLGQAPEHARRLRLGDYLLAHPETHPTVERWGARTFILTEEEKLLGRYLYRRAAQGQDRRALAEAGAAIDRADTDVERGLESLRRVGLLDWDRAAGAIAYALAPHWSELVGPLGFTFHTVLRASDERFNVPCALDFLLLARSEHADQRVEIFDSCVHCSERIHATIDHGRIVAVEPPEALVFHGGG